MDEKQLVAKAQAGDREALGALFMAHRAACYAFALRLSRRPEDAEDVCQEAFARAAEKLATYRGAGTLRSWLLGLVLHVQRDTLDSERARRRREGSYAMEKQAVGVESRSRVERDELRRQLDASLAELDENYRLPIVLTYEQGLSHAEAAAVLSMPEGTVKTNVRRGLEELRGLMIRAGYAGAAAGAVEAALAQAPAVAVPAGLTAFIKGLAVPGGIVGAQPLDIARGPERFDRAHRPELAEGLVEGHAAPLLAKGGMIMKVGLGIAAAGLLAGGVALFANTSTLNPPPSTPLSAPPAPPAKEKPALSSDWHEEQWVPEDFTGALGGGPDFGPAIEAGGGGNLCGDKAGNLYLSGGDTIDIVTPEGVKRRLAGTGVSGLRDGPANQAQFNFSPGYQTSSSIQCDGRGNIYVTDNGNGRVRRVFKSNDGKWMVDTVAGGGKRSLKDGESCAPTEVNFGGAVAVAAAPNGTLTIAGPYAGVFRVPPDGKTIAKLGPGVGAATADGDLLGNSYFISGGDNTCIATVTTDGKIVSRMAGLSPEVFRKECPKDNKPHHIPDGPPLDIYLDTTGTLAANPDGSCVYACGGDEYDIRRIPTDLKSTTSTLLQNGRWYVMMPNHPNRNHSGTPGGIDPKLTGKPTMAGGKLGNFGNCHIHGRDYEGNLYGSLYPWCGATQTVAGKGQLRTGIYRIRRVK